MDLEKNFPRFTNKIMQPAYEPEYEPEMVPLSPLSQIIPQVNLQPLRGNLKMCLELGARSARPMLRLNEQKEEMMHYIKRNEDLKL